MCQNSYAANNPSCLLLRKEGEMVQFLLFGHSRRQRRKESCTCVGIIGTNGTYTNTQTVKIYNGFLQFSTSGREDDISSSHAGHYAECVRVFLYTDSAVHPTLAPILFCFFLQPSSSLLPLVCRSPLSLTGG